MFGAAMPMSNSTTCNLSEEPSTVSSGVRLHDLTGLNPLFPTILPPHQQQPQKIKKKRSLPGNPDPDAEVIALSPKTLLATNRFVCEICKKGFQRDQNLQLHRRGHNLPWKLKQRNSKEVKKRAYVCPEPSCVHHNPSRALGDLTGIKKHYCRKHGEKKWKCHKCSKIYAVHSDWKAHSKTCGTRDYRCDCGTLFSRKDSFITHRAFCDALAEESARLCSAKQLGLMSTTGSGSGSGTNPLVQSLFLFPNPWDPSSPQPNPNPNPNPTNMNNNALIKPEDQPPLVHLHLPSPITNNNPNSFPNTATSAHLSATALLQKAATVGATTAEFGSLTQLDDSSLLIPHSHFINIPLTTTPPPPSTLGIHHDQHLTRDFLGLTSDAVTINDVPTDHPMTFTGDVYHHHPSLFKSRQPFGFLGTSTTAPHTWANY